MSKALVIGNSDGIGLALTRRLLEQGRSVIGLSRSPSPLSDEAYQHRVVDVTSERYGKRLAELAETDEVDLCVYCVGIGELVPLDQLAVDRTVIEVNLLGAVRALEQLMPSFLRQGAGHFIGLSSLADELVSGTAQSYGASKAGLSAYLEGLALRLRSRAETRAIHVSNVRFGFVDTKMAKAKSKPFLLTVEQAVAHLERCIARKPIRLSRPLPMVVLVRLLRYTERIKIFFG